MFDYRQILSQFTQSELDQLSKSLDGKSLLIPNVQTAERSALFVRSLFDVGAYDNWEKQKDYIDIGDTTPIEILDEEYVTTEWNAEKYDKVQQQYQEITSRKVTKKVDVFCPNDVEEGERLPTLIWVHGGGWISGDRIQIENYLKIFLAPNSEKAPSSEFGEPIRCTMVSVDYSIAPDFIYPTPIVQVNDAIKYLTENAERLHIDTTKLAFAGDSAGSQIATQMATVITNSSYKDELNSKYSGYGVNIEPALQPDQLKCMVLCCGGYNLDTLDIDINWGGTEDEIKEDIAFKAFIDTVMGSYLKSLNYRNNSEFDTFSISKSVDSNFPPSFITVGDADPLRNQSEELKEKLTSLDVYVDYLFHGEELDLQHEYQFVIYDVPKQTTLPLPAEPVHKSEYGRKAMVGIKAFLNTYLLP